MIIIIINYIHLRYQLCIFFYKTTTNIITLTNIAAITIIIIASRNYSQKFFSQCADCKTDFDWAGSNKKHDVVYSSIYMPILTACLSTSNKEFESQDI